MKKAKVQNFIGIVVLPVVLFLLNQYAVSWLVELISAPSDMKVFAGFIGAVALLFTDLFLFIFLLKKLTK